MSRLKPHITGHLLMSTSYLKSPIITLIVGLDEQQSILSAHQALLERSSYFQEQLSIGEQVGTSRLRRK